MTNSIIRFLNIVLAALLAGTSFGIWICLNPVNFSPSTYIEIQQNIIRTLNSLMISLVILTTVITIVSATLQRNDKPVFIALLVSAAFFVACILISRFGNQPINDVVMSWNINSLPNNWEVPVGKWWSFHILRTITELIALTIITWTNIKKGNNTTEK